MCVTTAPLVCIVDDAADYRFLVEHLFERHFPQYAVALFADGEVFLDKLLQLNQLPSLILLDLHMPHLDGYQTLLRLKEHPTYQQIPVVMMSSEALPSEISQCYQAHANAFLIKPIGLDSLQEQLAMICQHWLEPNELLDSSN